MTKEEILGLCDQIGIMTGYPYPKPSIDYVVERLTNQDKRGAVAVLKQIETQVPLRTPKPSELCNLVAEYNSNFADRQQRERAEHREPVKVSDRDSKGLKIFGASWRMMHSGNHTWQQLIDMLLEADKIQPNIGWGKTAADFITFIQQAKIEKTNIIGKGRRVAL